ncbi:MAG: tetraacyldisaccharide 4'-kinase [Methylovulum sp.]|uniref:tetraacyldisaccharide 4'-kinase n=1 Tax=Methylovulum sp. TaxID=1916980 RepID=UPI002614B6F5|nr:tetraacyldisaccharide 4'-kinase [Methylovulum sp.]MDD2724633.1 tetraacyldisaccharide 4'-kinase [Methylovulum sp.]MDD5123460.1 tetraacyldisaccharide 4'-kinase [Methylovulum sp.]
MKKRLARCIETIWYKDQFIGTWLMPLGFLFSDIARFRAWLYRIGVLKIHKLPVPVIVVGNITVGGTGKTPLIIWLAQMLKTAGFRPGIISRGYGGQSQAPQAVQPDSPVTEVGDEALLIVRQTACPLVVSPKRVAAAQYLLAHHDCNIILSDDGLQHYALGRTIEIAVVDGERRFGNGYCLPAGPLREPIHRLQSVDFVIVNGEKAEENEYAMHLQGDKAVNLATGASKPLSGFAGSPCHAVAGIGNPERFFKQLAAAGLVCKNHPFPDHYFYQQSDLVFADQHPVFMTEKDAVKCNAFATSQHWFVPVQAVPDADFAVQLLNLIQSK